MDGVNLFGLPVDDMKRAKDFFSKTFGWTFMATGMEGNHHFATTVPTDENGLPTELGGINGGLLERGAYEQQVTSIFIKKTDDVTSYSKIFSIKNALYNTRKNSGNEKILYI